MVSMVPEYCSCRSTSSPSNLLLCLSGLGFTHRIYLPQENHKTITPSTPPLCKKSRNHFYVSQMPAVLADVATSCVSRAHAEPRSEWFRLQARVPPATHNKVDFCRLGRSRNQTYCQRLKRETQASRESKARLLKNEKVDCRMIKLQPELSSTAGLP